MAGEQHIGQHQADFNAFLKNVMMVAQAEADMRKGNYGTAQAAVAQLDQAHPTGAAWIDSWTARMQVEVSKQLDAHAYAVGAPTPTPTLPLPTVGSGGGTVSGVNFNEITRALADLEGLQGYLALEQTTIQNSQLTSEKASSQAAQAQLKKSIADIQNQLDQLREQEEARANEPWYKKMWDDISEAFDQFNKVIKTVMDKVLTLCDPSGTATARFDSAMDDIAKAPQMLDKALNDLLTPLMKAAGFSDSAIAGLEMTVDTVANFVAVAAVSALPGGGTAFLAAQAVSGNLMAALPGGEAMIAAQNFTSAATAVANQYNDPNSPDYNPDLANRLMIAGAVCGAVVAIAAIAVAFYDSYGAADEAVEEGEAIVKATEEAKGGAGAAGEADEAGGAAEEADAAGGAGGAADDASATVSKQVAEEEEVEETSQTAKSASKTSTKIAEQTASKWAKVKEVMKTIFTRLMAIAQTLQGGAQVYQGVESMKMAPFYQMLADLQKSQGLAQSQATALQMWTQTWEQTTQRSGNQMKNIVENMKSIAAEAGTLIQMEQSVAQDIARAGRG